MKKQYVQLIDEYFFCTADDVNGFNAVVSREGGVVKTVAHAPVAAYAAHPGQVRVL